MWKRVSKAINRQAASPKGWFGRLIGYIWRSGHRGLNAEVIAALDVRRSHSVLEIGSGPGEALAAVSAQAGDGRVVGVDVSDLMASVARRRNRAAVARGQVEVVVGDIASIDLEEASLDRIFSVHCIYFWRDADSVLTKLAAALRPGGRLVLAFLPEGENIPARFRDPTYRFLSAEQVEAVLERAGLDVGDRLWSTASPTTVLLTATRDADRVR